MERTDFEQYLGQTFEVISQNPAMALELIELRQIQESQIPGTRVSPFGLLFRSALTGNHSGMLPRQIHTMRRPDGNTFAIYLEPVMNPGRPGLLYEAVFN